MFTSGKENKILVQTSRDVYIFMYIHVHIIYRYIHISVYLYMCIYNTYVYYIEIYIILQHCG